MNLPADYPQRVYAGVLGKMIGVYLGRPIEGWSYGRIMKEFGEIRDYVHEKCNVPLIVTDDDITGTFTFVRAMPDHGHPRDLTAAQIGNTWLNYIIERRTILWWGGMGNSTEHTAYLRLKNGIPAPQSGSMELNSQLVAEQIGSQIFIDAWAMIAPGDPEYAAELARRAASVSHDGAAIHAAQVIAAMEALAFVESDLNRLLDTALSLIPGDSVIYRLIGDLRQWHAAEPDWHKTREQICEKYGYRRYGGNCHIVPNHALIIHALLHGEDDFSRSMTIVNTCGWDTDCNAGNVGCLLGIKNGLSTFEGGPDWRGPVADRLFLATADGGRAISDALSEAYAVVNIARALADQAPLAPKDGARFHFSLPGAVQGFMAQEPDGHDGRVSVHQVADRGQAGDGALAIVWRDITDAETVRVTTPTFIPSRELSDFLMGRAYPLYASPTLYSGQCVQATLRAGEDLKTPLQGNFCIEVYQPDDSLTTIRGPRQTLEPGPYTTWSWKIPCTGGLPISSIGLEFTGEDHKTGTVYLDCLTWDGAVDTELSGHGNDGVMWRRAWMDGVDQFERFSPEAYRLMQNHGRGLIMHGTRDWTDYEVSAEITLHLAKAAGLAARVQGMRRYIALLLDADGKAKLVRMLDTQMVLAECDFPWKYASSHTFKLKVSGQHIEASIDGQALFTVDDPMLANGGIGLVVEEGRIMCDAVKVSPCRCTDR